MHSVFLINFIIIYCIKTTWPTDSAALKQCGALLFWNYYYVSACELYLYTESAGTDSVSSGPEDPD